MYFINIYFNDNGSFYLKWNEETSISYFALLYLDQNDNHDVTNDTDSSHWLISIIIISIILCIYLDNGLRSPHLSRGWNIPL